MKALLLILLGAVIFTAAGVKAIESSGVKPAEHGIYVGITLLGVIIGICGLVMNHHDHTRRR